MGAQCCGNMQIDKNTVNSELHESKHNIENSGNDSKEISEHFPSAEASEVQDGQIKKKELSKIDEVIESDISEQFTNCTEHYQHSKKTKCRMPPCNQTKAHSQTYPQIPIAIRNPVLKSQLLSIDLNASPKKIMPQLWIMEMRLDIHQHSLQLQ